MEAYWFLIGVAVLLIVGNAVIYGLNLKLFGEETAKKKERELWLWIAKTLLWTWWRKPLKYFSKPSATPKTEPPKEKEPEPRTPPPADSGSAGSH